MDALGFARQYGKAVLRHWRWLVFAAIGVVAKGADVFDFDVPLWIWGSIVAAGLVGAQYLAYVDVARELAVIQAQLRRLDTRQAKLAYLNEGLAELDRFYEEVVHEELDEAVWEEEHHARIEADFVH